MVVAFHSCPNTNLTLTGCEVITVNASTPLGSDLANLNVTSLWYEFIAASSVKSYICVTIVDY